MAGECARSELANLQSQLAREIDARSGFAADICAGNLAHGLISLKKQGCSDYGDYRANER